jgi:hypothetical protein
LHGERSARPSIATAEFFKKTSIVCYNLVSEPFIHWCNLPKSFPSFCPAFIPLAVMLLAIVIILFVSAGVSVVFAGPPAVIVFIAIKRIYVRGSLGEATALPGEPQRRG